MLIRNRQTILLIFNLIIHASYGLLPLHPNTGLNVSQLIEKYGYPFENHEITTEDGYILGTHRIPHGVNGTNGEKRIPIYFMHGLSGCSTYWLTAGPEQGLGFILADAGYDIWLGNQRGNNYALKHKWLNADTDKAQFFNYSLHEVGVYDIPACIDYILNETGQDSMFFIGHSQGTTDYLILGAERPEYNEKIKLSVLLGPTVHIQNATTPVIQALKFFYDPLNTITNDLHIYRFFPKLKIVELTIDLLCNDASPIQPACASVFFLICGFDWAQFDLSLIPVIVSAQPAGSSMMTVKHYGQIAKSGIFRQYDWGSEKNLLQYGQDTPPVYNLSAVTSPIALYHGQNDWIDTVPSVLRLASELPNVPYRILPEYSKFNHLDYIWATDGKEMIYDTMIEELKAHS